jgi:serine/threonine protein kinase
MGRPLKGHSGCRLVLNGQIVTKTSANEEYNKRLVAQANKQKAFSHEHIKTPEIYAIGETDGLAYFEMEYIRGISFVEYCRCKSITSIASKINHLTSHNCIKADFRQQVLDKCETLRGFPLELLDLADWTLPVGNCHGDLTFENVLVDDNDQLYLIDFLDSYVESSEIDCSKLMQDTYCSWSYRDEAIVPWHVLKFINDMLSTPRRYILLLINLYRILPYTTDRDTKEWLQMQIERTMGKIH